MTLVIMPETVTKKIKVEYIEYDARYSYYHDEYRDACLEKETPVVKKLVP